jgi:NTE family protein
MFGSKKEGIGLALSGGGARGLAHIGVLHGLNELGIRPSRVSGASAGSLVGLLYCAGLEPLHMLELIKDKSFFKIFPRGISTLGLTDHRLVKDFLMKHVGDIDFKDLKTPLSVSVTDINEGESVVLEEGKVIPAVIASSSIPVLFQPMDINGALYVDGGLMNNLPVEPLIERCEQVIGVGVCRHEYEAKVEGVRDIGIRSFQLAIWNTMESRMKECDIALDIREAGSFGMFDFHRGEELFNIGLEAVEAHKDNLLDLLEGRWNLKRIFT